MIPPGAERRFLCSNQGRSCSIWRKRPALSCRMITRVRVQTLQWLFWQVGGLGPAGGQCVHFRNYAPQPIDYALQRFGNENLRLISVLNRHLQGRDFIAGFLLDRRHGLLSLDIRAPPSGPTGLDPLSGPCALVQRPSLTARRPQRAYGWVQKVLGDSTYVAGKTDPHS